MVDAYEDDAVGRMTQERARAPSGSARVTLHPRIVYGGDKRPTERTRTHLHHLAHEQCFIANSVKTEIRVTPREP